MVQIFPLFLATLIASIGRSSSSGGVRSSFVVCKGDNASAAWSLIPARQVKSNAYSDSLSRRRANFPVLSVCFGIENRVLCSVLMVSVVFPMYDCNKSRDHVVPKDSFWVKSYRGSALISDRDQYPIGITVFSNFSCKNHDQLVHRRRLRHGGDDRLN